MCSVFWLFWLSRQYLPSDWLERFLWNKPNHGEGIISVKPRPKSVYDFLGLLYCFTVDVCVVPSYMWYISYFCGTSLFVLKVPLNTNKLNKTTLSHRSEPSGYRGPPHANAAWACWWSLWNCVVCVCNEFRCCAHIVELEHAYFSCGDNQMSLPDLHPEAVRSLPTTLTSDPDDLDCNEYVKRCLLYTSSRWTQFYCFTRLSY